MQREQASILIGLGAIFVMAMNASGACNPSPSPGPQPPPSAVGGGGPLVITDACGRACANLKALGCPEGTDAAQCSAACSHAQGGTFDLHPECLAAAMTPDSARGCGSVRCPGR